MEHSCFPASSAFTEPEKILAQSRGSVHSFHMDTLTAPPINHTTLQWLDYHSVNQNT